MLEYLLYFKSGRQNPMIKRNSVRPFSSPLDEGGYGDSYITNDLITDLYLDFIAKGRKSESIEYAQTRTGTLLLSFKYFETQYLRPFFTSKIHLSRQYFQVVLQGYNS